MGDLLEVALTRFMVGKPLSRDVFLRMAKNGKNIRIVKSGDTLRPELLANLTAGGVPTLLVKKITDNEIGESCQLYLENIERFAATMPSDPLGNDATAKQLESKQSNAFSINTAGSMLPEEEMPPTETEPKSPQFEILGNRSTEPTQEFTPDRVEQELGRTFSREMAPSDSQKVKEEKLVESTTKLVGSLDSEVETRIAASEEKFVETCTRIQGKLLDSLDDLVNITQCKEDEGGADAMKTLRSDLEACRSLISNSAANHLTDTIALVATRLDNAAQSFSLKSNESIKSPEEQSSVREIMEAISETHKKFITSGPADTTQNNLMGIELLAGEKFTPERSKTNHGKESGHDAEFSASLQSLSSASTNLDSNLFDSNLNKQDSASFTKSLNSNPESHSILGSFESNDKKNLDKFSDAARSAIYRELPATAGRLAALLAHSLGYVSPTYLTDVAFAAMAYFFRKEGKTLNGSSLPLLAKAVLTNANQEFDFGVLDSQEIVRLLDAYFDNPDCDRSNREISRKVLQATLAELNKTSIGVNRWNEARWLQFIANGPSIDAQSICGKASARAIMRSREIVS